MIMLFGHVISLYLLKLIFVTTLTQEFCEEMGIHSPNDREIPKRLESKFPKEIQR